MNQRRVVRALKRFCSDFKPIRDRLAKLGAIHVRTCRQIDYLFRVPGRETSRVKLRIEGDRQKISVYEKNQAVRRPDDVQSFELCEPRIKEILQTILPVHVVVEKNREVWNYRNAIFHLDTVEEIGQVFEIEFVHEDDGDNPGSDFYEQEFGAFLGKVIDGSNEDVLAAKADVTC